MGFHLIDQAACFAVGQPTVRGCTVPNGRSTQGVNSGRGSACAATAATCFGVACMAYPPSGRSMDCSAAIACCAAARSCRAKPYIGSSAVSMALQRLRLLSACMCSRMGAGVVLFNAMAGAVCAGHGVRNGVHGSVLLVET